jgi:hypothetical protein
LSSRRHRWAAHRATAGRWSARASPHTPTLASTARPRIAGRYMRVARAVARISVVVRPPARQTARRHAVPATRPRATNFFFNASRGVAASAAMGNDDVTVTFSHN